MRAIATTLVLLCALCARCARAHATYAYACTANCASGCGDGYATNTLCADSANIAYAYEGCSKARCADVCGDVGAVTTPPVDKAVSGSTFTCFNATHLKHSTAALATQQSVAMDCGPGNHEMQSMYMAGSTHGACAAAWTSAATRGTTTTLVALAATLAAFAAR